jgi:hypothetical protein
MSSLVRADVAVDLSASFTGRRYLRDLRQGLFGGLNRCAESRDCNLSEEFLGAIEEGRLIRCRRFSSDVVSHVNSEEVGVRHEEVDGLEADMVGVHEVWIAPSHLLHRGVDSAASVFRFRADNGVFAERLVPDGGDGHAVLLRHFQRT